MRQARAAWRSCTPRRRPRSATRILTTAKTKLAEVVKIDIGFKSASKQLADIQNGRAPGSRNGAGGTPASPSTPDRPSAVREATRPSPARSEAGGTRGQSAGLHAGFDQGLQASPGGRRRVLDQRASTCQSRVATSSIAHHRRPAEVRAGGKGLAEDERSGALHRVGTGCAYRKPPGIQVPTVAGLAIVAWNEGRVCRRDRGRCGSSPQAPGWLAERSRTAKQGHCQRGLPAVLLLTLQVGAGIVVEVCSARGRSRQVPEPGSD